MQAAIGYWGHGCLAADNNAPASGSQYSAITGAGRAGGCVQRRLRNDLDNDALSLAEQDRWNETVLPLHGGDQATSHSVPTTHAARPTAYSMSSSSPYS